VSSVVEILLATGRLTRISRDRRLINQLLEQTQLHIKSAELLVGRDDSIAAFQIAYDAVRKSCVALLAYHGLRATSRGGHHALFECVAELTEELHEYVAEFDILRQQRNSYEYPTMAGEAPIAAQIQHAVATARDVRRIIIELVRE